MDVKLCSMLLLSAFLMLRLCGEVSSQDLHQVQAEQIPPVHVGGVARFRCSFVGENITMQYVSWTKFVKNGRRTFVYEYSQHPPLARPYHDFIGRATITNADMNDNRFSYLNDIPQEPLVTSERGGIESKKAPTPKPLKKNSEKAASNHWFNVHESIYGLFSNSLAKGQESPSHKDIDDLFEGMEYKDTLTHKIKKLKPPVSRSDIRRALHPYNTQEPRTMPMRWSNLLEDAASHESDGSEASHGELYDDSFWDSRIIRRRRKRRAVPVHHIDLQLVHVLLSDEATYECLVKPVNGPAVSSSMRLFVQAPPTSPVLDDGETSHADGSNVTLTCKVNAGKPAGEVTWTRRKLEDSSFHLVPDEMYETEAHLMANYTTSVVSRLKLQLTAGDDGATYRCSVSSPLISNTEMPPFAQTSMTVLYPPRGGRILFDTAEGRYYCHARAKPAPSYSWVWLRADGRQTVMSTNRYLDLSGMRRSGYYRFHCLASNKIQGIKHTKVMATKLRVIAPDTESPTRERQPVSRKYWRRRMTTVTQPPTTTMTVPTTTTTTPPTTTTIPTTTTTRPTTTTTTTPLLTTTPLPVVVDSGVASNLVYPGGMPESASRQLIPTFDVTGQKSLEGFVSRNKWNNIMEPGLEEVGKPETDYYYYYFYDDGRKERQPAHSLNRFSPWSQNGPVVEERHEAPLPPTRPPPTESPLSRYVEEEKPLNRYVEEKTSDWDRLSEMGQGLGFSMEALPELKDTLNTDLKQPVPYNPFASMRREAAPAEAQTDYDGSIEETPQGPLRRSENRDRKRKRNHKNHYDNDNEDRNRLKKATSSSRQKKTRTEDEAKSNKYEKVMATSSVEFDCTRLRRGVHGAGCRAFYRCVSGRTYTVQCRHPYVYNKNTGKCGEPKAAPSPCGKFRDCSNKPSKKFVDKERGCKYYYTCYRGYFMGHNECNPGLVFNEKEQVCDWPSNVKEGCDSQTKKKATKKNLRYRD